MIIKGETNLLISVGNILKFVIEASNELKRKKINNAVIDLRYVKPLDNKVLKIAFKKFRRIFVVEEHYISGGVGSSIIEWTKKNSFNSDNVFLLGADNKFVNSSGNQFSARDKVGLSIKKIVNKISKIVKKT